MSRHISGELAGDAREVAKAARRVAEDVVGVRPRGERVDQREREHVRQVRHRREDRGRARPASSARTRAPQASHSAATARRRGAGRSRAAASARRCGRRTASANAAAAPVCSVPAIGCPGTKRGSAAPSARARRGDHVLLGAAGVGDDRARAERGRPSPRTAPGTAPPASRAARGRRRRARASSRRPACTPRSTMPTLRARRRGWPACGRRRRPRRPRPPRFSASANEPPISPTPTTTSLPIARRDAEWSRRADGGARRVSARKRRLQRRRGSARSPPAGRR